MANSQIAAQIGAREPRYSPLKVKLASVAAVLLAAIFLVSGIWKLTDPEAAAVRMTQALVPRVLSMPAALGFGIAETFTGVLLLLPRYRRWGAWIAGALLVAFMVYIGVFYNTLRGEDCNCFPWIRRVVGPMFFISDAAMLLMAVVAGWWSVPSRGFKQPAWILAAVCVFAVVSYGINIGLEKGSQVIAPASVMVDGKPVSLREGKVFLFFFNPECLHCAQAARNLSRLDWGETRVIAVATQLPQFIPDFLKETGLKALGTGDATELRSVFRFVDVPYGVALENGKQVAAFTDMESEEVLDSLRKQGFAR